MKIPEVVLYQFFISTFDNSRRLISEINEDLESLQYSDIKNKDFIINKLEAFKRGFLIALSICNRNLNKLCEGKIKQKDAQEDVIACSKLVHLPQYLINFYKTSGYFATEKDVIRMDVHTNFFSIKNDKIILKKYKKKKL